MPVFKFEQVVFSFLFIHLPISSDCMNSMLTSVECLQRKDVCYLIFG